MKILSNLKNMKLKVNENNVELIINESNIIKYNLTNSSNNEILTDLIEHKAFATTLLFLNENYELIVDKDSFINESNIIDFYKDCEDLLNENVKVVTEKGPLLVSIKGYPIYEVENGILRGSGENKIFESFDFSNKSNNLNESFFNLYKAYDNLYNISKYSPKELIDFLNGLKNQNRISEKDYNLLIDFSNKYQDLINVCGYESNNLNENSSIESNKLKDLCDFLQSNNITNPEARIDEIESYLEDNHLSIVTVVPNKIFKVAEFNSNDNAGGYIGEISVSTNGTWRYHEDDILEEEGTQVSDIAPKVDQSLGINKPKIVSTKINGLKENLVLRGFLRNELGQYERGNYILCLENNKYIAINKDKLKESL